MFYLKSISSKTVKYWRAEITFMRIGQLLAWYSEIDGEHYGDFITIATMATPEEQAYQFSEGYDLLCKQMEATVDLLFKNK